MLLMLATLSLRQSAVKMEIEMTRWRADAPMRLRMVLRHDNETK